MTQGKSAFVAEVVVTREGTGRLIRFVVDKVGVPLNGLERESNSLNLPTGGVGLEIAAVAEEDLLRFGELALVAEIGGELPLWQKTAFLFVGISG